MHALLFLAFGVGIGLIAHWTVPDPSRRGPFTSIVVGIIGALSGGFLARAVGIYEQGRVAGLLMSVVGSVSLIVLYRVKQGMGKVNGL